MKPKTEHVNKASSSNASSTEKSTEKNELRGKVKIYTNHQLFFSANQVEYPETNTFKDLIKKLANKDEIYNFSALFEQAGIAETLKVDSHGWSLFHHSAKSLNSEAISWCLQNQMENANRPTDRSRSIPLMTLIQNLKLAALSNKCFVNILKLLIKASDYNLKNTAGQTSFNLATMFANYHQLYNKEAFLTLFHPETTDTSDYSHSVQPVIVKPSFFDAVSDTNYADGGYAEDRGQRPTQEDSLVIDGNIELSALSPQQICERLWSTFQILDRKLPAGIDDGSTAAAVVCDVKRGLITSAFTGDASAFVAVYNKEGKVIAVKRLNERVDNPHNPLEIVRIKSVGGKIDRSGKTHRILETKPQQKLIQKLAISRSIGDRIFKPAVCADPHVHQTSFEKLANDLGISVSDIGKIQIICTCDGYTDVAGRSNQTKEDHEALLLRHLRRLTKNPMYNDEAELAKALTEYAIRKGSADNVSVAIQTVYLNSTKFQPGESFASKTEPALTQEAFKAFFIGLFDGHNGKKTSEYLADNFGRALRAQFALPQEKYQKGSAGSVYESEASKEAFLRDHPQFADFLALAQTAKPDMELQEQGEQELIPLAKI